MVKSKGKKKELCRKAALTRWRRTVIQENIQSIDQQVEILEDQLDTNQAVTSEFTTDQDAIETVEKNATTENVCDRRICDINFLFRQILSDSDNHPLSSCNFLNMELIREKRHGLHSTFLFKCKMCSIEKTISTYDENTRMMQPNEAVALGAISVGIGYTQCEEFFSILNVPFMHERTFKLSFEKVGDVIHTTSLDSMMEAAAEEKQLAIELGDIDEDGIPFITVICDGTWSKRSYGINYDASSGAACIIGQRTSKLLFLGVRNKYCTLCAMSDKKKELPVSHVCSKNWHSTSTSMESDIISEGFKNSVSLHGLKYLKLVGDGDSSVYRKLLDIKPYGMKTVEKIECRNHLLRNFCKKLKEICGRKKSNSKGLDVPVILRSRLKNSIMRFRTSIVKSTKYRSNQMIDFPQKVRLLKEDLLNSPSHIFGEHKKCKEIGYFKCSPKDDETNIVPNMLETGLYQDTLAVLHRLIQNIPSLLLNMTNNDAEHYNSVIAKFTGGKRINFTLGNQYTTRCEAAAISFNTKGRYHTRIFKSLTGYSPKGVLTKYSNKKLKRLQNIRKRDRIRRRLVATVDKDYGPEASAPDVCNVENFETKKRELICKIKNSCQRRDELERQTIGQSTCHLWREERQLRLTSSHFGAIIKMRASSTANKVTNLLHSNFFGNKHTRYGLESEPFARQQFNEEFGVQIEDCGLFIHKKYGYLGASPDGLIGTNGLVEIKCPSTAKDKHPANAIKEKIIKFATLDENNVMRLKINDNYYYQVQGQLNICEREYCYFVIWTRKGMLVEKIYRDEEFWETKMIQKLKSFYLDHLLPAIVMSNK